MNPPAVVLLSGGLDSATVLAIAESEGYAPHCLSFDYGQRHGVELRAARDVAGERPHFIMPPDLSYGGSALTKGLEVPKHDNVEELDSSVIPSTYVPARNTIFLACALGSAEVVGADHIFAGMNALDYSGYPDCRLEYIQAFQRMANLATKRGVEGHLMTIHTPLIEMGKQAIVQRGFELGVDYAPTWSCYDPQLVLEAVDVDPTDYRACGRCDSCLLRLRAFADAGAEDPAAYVQPAAR